MVNDTFGSKPEPMSQKKAPVLLTFSPPSHDDDGEDDTADKNPAATRRIFSLMFSPGHGRAAAPPPARVAAERARRAAAEAAKPPPPAEVPPSYLRADSRDTPARPPTAPAIASGGSCGSASAADRSAGALALHGAVAGGGDGEDATEPCDLSGRNIGGELSVAVALHKESQRAHLEVLIAEERDKAAIIGGLRACPQRPPAAIPLASVSEL